MFLYVNNFGEIMKNNIKEKTIDSKTVYDGKIVNLRIDTVEVSKKGITKREIISHPGGVACVAVNEEGKILLVSQFRKAFDLDVTEIPAGKLEKGENPDDAIVREIKEETGYDLIDVEKKFIYYPSPGYTNEIGHMYFGKAVNRGKTHFDTFEDIELLEITLDKALDMIKNDEIRDAKTIMGILCYACEQNKKF